MQLATIQHQGFTVNIDVNGEGAWRLTSCVEDDATPFSWYETRTFYGYDVHEAVTIFTERCIRDGLRPSDD